MFFSCEDRSCCATLRLYASDKLQEEYPQLFGAYRYMEKDTRGGPIYKHLKFERYIIRDYEGTNWKVTDRPDISGTRFLSKYYADGQLCPELSQKQFPWKYWDNQRAGFYFDNTIRLDCDLDA